MFAIRIFLPHSPTHFAVRKSWAGPLFCTASDEKLHGQGLGTRLKNSMVTYEHSSGVALCILLQVVQLPKETYATDIHWFPHGVGSKKTSNQSDLFVLACTDGQSDSVVL